MKKLKTCPFCGGEASSKGIIKYHKSHKAWFEDGTQILKSHYCNCIVCGASTKGLVGQQTEEMSIKKWNKRTWKPFSNKSQ